MMTPTPEIRQCLDAKLLAFLPQLSLDPETDVAWPNSGFDPEVDHLYLRPTCLFSPTEAASLGTDGFERLQGIYQISVLEVQGKGLGRSEDIARSLVDEFRGGTVLNCCGYEVRVTSAYCGTPTPEDNRLHIPVSVVWYCYAQK